MCKLTPQGYLMKDGTLIPLNEKLNLSSIAPHHIEDLNNNATSQWEALILRQSLISIEEKLDNVLENEEDTMRRIALEEIKKEPSRQLSKAKKFVVGISIFLILILNIINLVEKF